MGNCRALVTTTKTCQNCGARFACGGSCCWCDEVRLDANVRTELQARFTDCLCRACLELAAAGRLRTDGPILAGEHNG
jgi:hypothetical protein